jgi:hypothetical protein
MVILPIIGISCAILHHTFYNALDGRPSIPLREVDMWGFEVDITGWAFIIGNTFSWIVGQIFSWSINIVLVNRFWHLLHDRQFTVREVDDIFDIKATFYTKTAIRRATGLIFIAAASFAIGVITIFPPAALTSTIQSRDTGCNIPTVRLPPSAALLDNGAVESLALMTVASGSIVPPTSNPCYNCTYNTTFSAPTINCSTTTSHPFSPDTELVRVLWNATFVRQEPSVYIWSRQGNFYLRNFTEPEIVRCSLLTATYHVNVEHGNGTMVTGIATDIRPYDEYDPITYATYLETLFAYSCSMDGTAKIDYTTPGPSRPFTKLFDTNAAVAPALVSRNESHWALVGGLQETLFMVMQNMSLGLLGIDLSLDPETPTITSVLRGTCLTKAVVYAYDWKRLVTAYSLGGLITIVCAIFGVLSVRAGKGGRNDFTRLVDAILTKDLMGKAEDSAGRVVQLPRDVTIKAVNGHFEVVELPKQPQAHTPALELQNM